MTKSKYFGSKVRRNQLIVGLFLITLISVFVWWRYYSDHAPQPLRSSANEGVEPHWYHTTLPFNLPVKSFTRNKSWAEYLGGMSKVWEDPGIVDYGITRGSNFYECSLAVHYVMGNLNFCSYQSSTDGYLGRAGYLQDLKTGHIIAADMTFNDYYLFGPTGYNTPELRRFILCGYFGFTLGLPYRSIYSEPADGTSCMVGGGPIPGEQIPNRQSPDSFDLVRLKNLYDNLDVLNLVMTQDMFVKINKQAQSGNYGRLLETSQDNSAEIYEMDLDNGIIMKTIVFKAISKN